MHQAAGFMAWHYTTAARFMQMLKQRAIVPGAGGVGDDDDDEGGSANEAAANSGRPVIWFSVNDEFEPSACLVARQRDGSARHCSVSETAERGQGLVRLGVPVRTLLTCTELRRQSMMSDETWEQLCEEARAVGSDTDQWFGCLRNIPLRECVVEVRDDDGQWRRMQAAGHRPMHHGQPGSSDGNFGSHHLVGR